MNTFEFVQCSKNDVPFCSMSNFVNLAKALLGSMFDIRSFESKNRVFEFDHQYMNMFEFVRCSKNDVQVRSMFDKMVFDPSLISWTSLDPLEDSPWIPLSLFTTWVPLQGPFKTYKDPRGLQRTIMTLQFPIGSPYPTNIPHFILCQSAKI